MTAVSQSPKWVARTATNFHGTDTLPLNLLLRLRANREELLLADSHGQIWNELRFLADGDPSLFDGGTRDVERKLEQQLDLKRRAACPVRRLGTLWRNTAWQVIISRWCQYPLGLATFNVSTFEWMASCRFDDVRPLCPVGMIGH